VHRFFGSRALAIVGVSLLAVVGGALLAWWQWTRYTSSTGTLQNLGYVLQWPLFGVFPAFMFWRIGRAAQHERELDRAAEQLVPEQRQDPETPARPVSSAERTHVDPRLTYTQKSTLDYEGEQDQELLAYNHYLAQLADREQRHAG
jgi:DNA-binding transcriptional regulator of glucitol operon